MSDPLVNEVTDDDGTQRWVAAGGPSDNDTTPGPDVAETADGQPQADPNDPDVDQPAQVIQEAPDAAADAADGDGADAGNPERRP